MIVSASWASGPLGRRFLARVGDTLPVNLAGPRCVLACVDGEEHSLGIALAELCLKERGWAPVWLGQRTPISELENIARAGDAEMIAITAAISADPDSLSDTATRLGRVCAESDIDLILGGAGAWPRPLQYGRRLESFAAFDDHLLVLGR